MTADVSRLVEQIGDPRRFVVVLDFDGTLSPIVEDPDAATMAPGAREAVAELAQVTEVAILSGRHVDDLAPRVEGLPVLLLGGHGTEVRHPDGTRESFLDLEERREVLDELESSLSAALDPDDGWVVERKPASIAVHHRRVADPGATLEQVRTLLRQASGDWELLDGKAVTELRPAGIDKGTAIDWLVDRHTDRDVLVVGDDVTDEDAFEAAISHGGTAVLVGDRKTAAPHRIGGPSEVVDLLHALLAAAQSTS